MGQEYLSSQSGGQQQGGNSNGGFDIGSISSLIGHAQNNDQSGSGNSAMFGEGGCPSVPIGECFTPIVLICHDMLRFAAANYLKSQQGNISGDVDDEQLMQNHNIVNNSNEQVHSSQIGDAAALSSIKNVLGGSSGGGSSGGDMQSKMIGLAMAQASKMFDDKSASGQATGNKQDAMNSAGESVMKLMMKYKMNSMMGGGSSSGLSSLLSSVM
ncbi:hypothetical protein CBS101457_001390 [Exobasidium rhododendri]|nr:hypothetical protein CBS101457_001390 [Exobasidium rhododendri]